MLTSKQYLPDLHLQQDIAERTKKEAGKKRKAENKIGKKQDNEI